MHRRGQLVSRRHLRHLVRRMAGPCPGPCRPDYGSGREALPGHHTRAAAITVLDRPPALAVARRRSPVPRADALAGRLRSARTALGPPAPRRDHRRRREVEDAGVDVLEVAIDLGGGRTAARDQTIAYVLDRLALERRTRRQGDRRRRPARPGRAPPAAAGGSARGSPRCTGSRPAATRARPRGGRCRRGTPARARRP